MLNRLCIILNYLKAENIWRLCVLAILACSLVGCGRQPEYFTIIALPDTQFYAEKYPHIFTSQTQWIREQVNSENIKYVLHLGDITQNNIDKEWKLANKSMSILDGYVPYSLTLGNHDMGPGGSTQNRNSPFDNYFGYSRYQLEEWYGGHFADSNRNNYTFFEVFGMKFMVVSLEYGPTDEMLHWAGKIIDQHPDYRVIILTHVYMFDDNTRQGPGDRSNPHLEIFGETNDGEDMWEKLVNKHRNIFLVINGHIDCDRYSYLTSTGIYGNKVLQILANYQHMENGGNGYLVIIKFVPDENKIYLRTYSPYLKKFLATPGNQLELEYKMMEK